ncbi:MAG: ABC transporter substrate-binding protein [Actinobacteria bacterium]|nr:ABC transporter substrate-binding protein [Actinomycetota bacterium]
MVSPRRLGAVIAVLAVGASGCFFDSADAVEDPATPAPNRSDAASRPANGLGPEGTGPAPANVTIALRVDVDTFDPLRSLGDSGAQQAFQLTYETMVRLAPDGSIVAGAASEWTTDGASTTFTIAPGLSCVDGTPLDAAAIAESLRVFGAEGAMTANAVFGSAGLLSVTSDDAAQTVTVTTAAPYNDMLIGMTSAGYLVCPGGLADREALQEKAAGSGPYELVSSKSGEYTFKRRDSYTNTPAGTDIADLPTTITLVEIGDDGTAADRLGQGRVSIAGTQSSISEFLLTDPSLVSVPAAGFGTNAVTFMQTPDAVTLDPNLRVGIAMLLDSVKGATAETAGLGVSHRTLLTPNLACYSEAAEQFAPKYDQVAAMAHLDATGYQLGAGGFRSRPDGSPLIIRVVGNNLQGTAPQYIAEQLEKAGFHVDLFMGTYSESIAKLLTDQFDVGIYPFVSTYPAPSSWPNQIGTTAMANFAKVSNPAFDEYAALAQAAPKDSEEYCTLWAKAEQAALEAANVVPFSQPVNHWFGNGVTFNATYFTVDPFSIRSI